MQPVRSLLFLVVLEAALFFHLRGGLIAAALTLPVLVAAEVVQRADIGCETSRSSRSCCVADRGRRGSRRRQARRGRAWRSLARRRRADEAERLRDDLGRRIDLLEATNRAARALGSSLDLDEAFTAFTQELRGLVPFDRAAILLLEGDMCE